MKLMIQIPCLNEATTLAQVVADLPTELPGIDVIETLVIDDGSVDDTVEVAIALGVNYVVRHNHNRGLAAAFKTGLETCLALGADLIVTTDGDNQYPGRLIGSLVSPIVTGNAELVVGDRQPGSDRRFTPTKRFLQRLGRRVVSRLAGRDLRDPVSGFRAYSRYAAQRTHIVTGYSYTIESLLQAVHKGIAIEFVTITTNNATRPSRLFRSIPAFLTRSAITILRVFFMFQPLNVLLWCSALIMVAGGIPIVRFLVLYASGHGSGHLQSLVLGATLVMLSATVFLAGLLGDLIEHNRRLLETILDRSEPRITEPIVFTHHHTPPLATPPSPSTEGNPSPPSEAIHQPRSS